MPTEGDIDRGYLKRIDRIVKVLTKRKIWVLLDFHQDAFNEKFDGEGFPDWAVHDDGLPFFGTGNFFVDGFNAGSPAQLRPPLRQRLRPPGPLRPGLDRRREEVAAPALHHGLRPAERAEPGSSVATCLNPLGCPAVDATLQNFYEPLRKAIRTVDTTHDGLVRAAPALQRDLGLELHQGRRPERRVLLAQLRVPARLRQRRRPPERPGLRGQPAARHEERRRTGRADGAGSLLTEFGAGDDLEDLARITSYADDHLVGWMYWAYKLWNDPTGSQDEGLFHDDADRHSVKRGKLDSCSRTPTRRRSPARPPR